MSASSSRELVPYCGRLASVLCSPKKTNVEVFRETYSSTDGEKLETLIHKRNQFDYSNLDNRRWLETLKGRLSFGLIDKFLFWFFYSFRKCEIDRTYYVYIAGKIAKLCNTCFFFSPAREQSFSSAPFSAEEVDAFLHGILSEEDFISIPRTETASPSSSESSFEELEGDLSRLLKKSSDSQQIEEAASNLTAYIKERFPNIAVFSSLF